MTYWPRVRKEQRNTIHIIYSNVNWHRANAKHNSCYTTTPVQFVRRSHLLVGEYVVEYFLVRFQRPGGHGGHENRFLRRLRFGRGARSQSDRQYAVLSNRTSSVSRYTVNDLIPCKYINTWIIYVSLKLKRYFTIPTRIIL